MRMTIKFTSILLIVACLCSVPSSLLAQQGQLLQAEPSKVAMQALGLAKHYYSKGNFEKAAELFMEAYQLDARVEFMFNAARAYQRAIKLKKAKSLFNRCVKTKKAPAVVVEKAKIYLREIENMEKIGCARQIMLQFQLCIRWQRRCSLQLQGPLFSPWILLNH